MTVRIGIDGRVLTDRYHGIGRVTWELVREMAATPGVEVVVFAGEERSRRFDIDTLALLPDVEIAPVRLRAVDVRQLWRWRSLVRGALVDVMVFPYHLGAAPLLGCPTVALVHDCIFETDPRYVPSRSIGVAYRMMTSLVARTATIATVSRASAREVERYYGQRVDPGLVIGAGVDQQLRADPAAADRLAREYGLEPGYVLHVGAQRPHKNAAILVEAIARVPGARLVLVGSADERFGDEVGPAIERYAVADRVTRLPFVPEELLGSLYAGARLLAYPSLVEGFGLPVLEAMVARTPVLASDVPVLREVGGTAAQYVPPGCAEAWAAGITRLLADDDLHRGLVAAGAAHASHFTWGAAAARLVSACQTLTGTYLTEPIR
ncbi:glycosyltransferase family 4 protein [Actinoplanes sp. NPDC051859]|uniref:glycosyltransferase family 4 protein n=1 Tax=Actinoplanes sp. NPDC051859 TaxID=3363909 RepID=UPI0037BCC5A3